MFLHLAANLEPVDDTVAGDPVLVAKNLVATGQLSEMLKVRAIHVSLFCSDSGYPDPHQLPADHQRGAQSARGMEIVPDDASESRRFVTSGRRKR